MHVSFFLLLLLASYLPLASAAGNCSSLTPQSLSVGRQRITFGGLGVVLQPLVGSVPSTDYRVEWSFAWLVERNRTSHYVNGIPFSPSLCISPSDTAFRITPIPNPLEPGSPTEPCAEDSNIPCGALLSYIAGEDLDCWMEKKVEPFLNATRTSHYVHYSLPTAPTFELIAGFHLVDKNVTDYPLRNSTAITNEYIAGLLKISYEINNLPWKGPEGYQTGPNSDSSWLEVWFNTTFSAGPGDLFIESRDTARHLRYTADNKDVELLVNVDSSYILDGIPYFAIPETNTSFPFHSDYPVSIALSSTVSLCAENVGHWEEAIYDPTLGFLFSLSPDPGPSSRRSSFVPWGVVGVVLVLVVLAVIAGAAVYAFVIVPKRRSKESAKLHNEGAAH